MTEEHLTVDEVADFSEGLLDAPDAARVEAHVAECASCADALAAVHEVSVQLAEVAGPVVIPAAVAGDLAAALSRASVERQAAVPSLDERRATKSAATVQPRSKPRFSWVLAGAAAAVAAVVVGPMAVDALRGGFEPDAMTSADSGTDSGVQAPAPNAENEGTLEKSPADGAATNPTREADPSATQELPRRLNPANLAGFATKLEGQLVPTEEFARGGITKAARQCATYRQLARADLAAADVAVAARWRGKQAVVVLDQAKSSVRVYDCRKPVDLLYRSGY